MRAFIVAILMLIGFTASAQFPFESKDSIKAVEHLEVELLKIAQRNSQNIYLDKYYANYSPPIPSKIDSCVSCLNYQLEWVKSVIETYGPDFISVTREYEALRDKSKQLITLVKNRTYSKIWVVEHIRISLSDDEEMTLEKIYICKDGVVCIKY